MGCKTNAGQSGLARNVSTARSSLNQSDFVSRQTLTVYFECISMSHIALSYILRLFSCV